MNDFDLKSKLKGIPVPERTEEYWNDFPSRVQMQLQRERREPLPRHVRHPNLAWAGGLAFALALVFICLEFHPLQTASVAFAKHERHVRTQLAQLDAGLHVLMFNPHGMGYLLAEAN